MPKVTFLPSNRTVEVKAGDTLLEAALAHHVSIQHACGGFCACTTCHLVVKSGMDQLSPMEEDEQDRLEFAVAGLTPTSRLGCQAKIQGDVVVQVMNED
jgi:2Fe-2S ferredoxin